MEVIENSSCMTDRRPSVSSTSWMTAMTAPKPNCSWKRNQM